MKIMDSHVHPGCVVVADVDPQDGAVPVEFSDGSVTGGVLTRRDENWVELKLDAYTTRRGARIPEKIWLLRKEGQDLWRTSQRLDRKK